MTRTRTCVASVFGTHARAIATLEAIDGARGIKPHCKSRSVGLGLGQRKKLSETTRKMRKAAGPSGRRPRTKPVRDNTAVAGLCSDAEASAVLSGSKSGGGANPFKSFLEACDCSEAEEALVEVGIERSAPGKKPAPRMRQTLFPPCIASLTSLVRPLAPQGVRSPRAQCRAFGHPRTARGPAASADLGHPGGDLLFAAPGARARATAHHGTTGNGAAGSIHTAATG